MNDARYYELLEEATIDCYDEYEEFSGVEATLEDQLHFPLQAEVAGVRVEVTGLESKASNLRRGIVATVKNGSQSYTVGLAELTLVDADEESVEWLEMYKRWSST